MLARLLKSIKNIFRIFKADLTKICSNWVSLVVIGGLIFLPSLYAWVNIYASWDPYGNTKGIKVGIVNEDKGSSIKNTEINIGESVMESLQENDALGWTFFKSREEGIEEVNKGDVYATIIIPSDFSAKIATLVDKKAVKPNLEYYVNEKINAIAPKITDKGASTIQNSITTSFVETVADKIVEVMHSVGVEIDRQYPVIEKLHDRMQDLSGKFPELEERLASLAEKAKDGKVTIDRKDKNVQVLQELIDQIVSFNGDVTESLNELSTKPEEVIPDLKENLVLIQNIFNDISTSTLELKEDIELNKPTLISDIDKGITKIENAETRLNELADKAAELDSELSESIKNINKELINILNDYEETLEKLQDKLDNTDEALAILDRLIELNQAASGKVQQLKAVITAFSKQVDSQLAKLQAIVEKIESIIPPISKPETPPDAQEPASPEEDVQDTAAPEENAGPVVDESVTDNVKEALAMVENAKEGLSANKTLFADALYELEDISSDLNAVLSHTSNPSQLSQDAAQLRQTSRSLSGTIRSLRTLIEMRTNSISDRLTSIEEMLADTNAAVKEIQSSISAAATGGQEKIDRILANIDKVQSKLTEVADRVTKTLHSEAIKVQDKVNDVNASLTELKERLSDLSGKIEDKTVVEDTLQDISQLTYNIQASLDSTIDLLDSDLIAKLKEKINDLTGFVGDITNLLESMQGEFNSLREFGQRLGEKSELLSEDILKMRSHVPDVQEKVDNIVTKIDELNENVDIRSLVDQMIQDNSDKSSFLASPVNLETTSLYPMANYGTGLTPFYTTLCLWVGALLLASLLTTKAKNADFAYTPVEEYFAKYFLFALCGVMQAFIAASGDIIVLGVRPAHPFLFVALAMMYSVVFMSIVYTLVALFGNVGKAVGVVLLVLQLGGGGGTFPIQVTPQLFQKIHSFLPFTYAISGMREAIAGIYTQALVDDVVALLGFFVAAIILGALFKKKANARLHKFAHQLGHSGVVEH